MFPIAKRKNTGGIARAPWRMKYEQERVVAREQESLFAVAFPHFMKCGNKSPSKLYVLWLAFHELAAPFRPFRPKDPAVLYEHPVVWYHFHTS